MPRGNKIQIRTGTGVPSASDFAASEPAWDGVSKLYIKNAAGAMVEVGGAAASVAVFGSAASFPGTGLSTVVYLDSTRSRLYRWVSADSVYAEIGTIGGLAGEMDGGVYA